MRLVGTSHQRVEDQRILTGRGRYVDDIQLPKMLHATFLRSPVAHARITNLDVNAARRAPGVVAVLTGEDMKAMAGAIQIPAAGMVGMTVPTFHALATDKVRLVGDLVALVVAQSRSQAEDASELIEVDYDPLPAVATYEDALDPNSAPLFDDLGSNVVWSNSETFGDLDAAFAEADRVIEVTLQQHRVANVPMETRGAIADYDPGSGELTFYASTQNLHMLRMQLANQLGHPMERLRVLAGDVGGAFGLKAAVYREDLCVAAASRHVGRPVKWIEDRNEHLIASGHAREASAEVQVAVTDDGTMLGLKVKLVTDQGAYPWFPLPVPLAVGYIQLLLPGPTRVKAYSFDVSVVSINKCVYTAYRGPWEMETWVRERVLDVIAQELGLDPAEVHQRNLVDGDANDRLITGPSLAGVSSRQTFDRALELVDYDAFRREQETARSQGRYLGIGFATFIEPAPGPPELRVGLVGSEQARVRLEADGHLLVVTSQAPHGQGHETTIAQVAADEMGVPFEHVKVMHGDTRMTPFSVLGTAGSRAATWASGAVLMSTRQLKQRVLAIAAEMLEIGPDDLEITDGVVVPKGVPEKSLPLAAIAMTALMDSGSLPPGTDPNLEAFETFVGDGITGSGWSGGTHLCTVEVDIETGQVRFLRYIVVEDCGRLINPAIVEGQIRGGVAQGIGEVLYEHCAYDEDGNYLASSLMDYLVPTSAEIPTIEIDHLETDPEGELGFRGVGEGGAIVAPAAVTSAIEDALRPFGARVLEQYLPPAKVLELAGVVS
jgi:aerobic carbon-monoxide dehydrogenase large subunit